MTEVPKKRKVTTKKPHAETSDLSSAHEQSSSAQIHEVVPNNQPIEESVRQEDEISVIVEKTASEKGEFTASQGRLRKLFLKAGLTGRIAKDVFEMLDEKIKCLVLQRIKSLKIKDKKIVYEDSELKCDTKGAYELPITPFRDYLKTIIRREHDVSRISPDIVEALHCSIEKDIIRLCQYAQDIMKNSSRKTLFANDIEVAGKALL
jgi:histone H3/H4